MGDQDVLTPEDLKILGEGTDDSQKTDQELSDKDKGTLEGAVKPEEKTEAESKEPEHTEEEKAAVEKMGLRIEEGFIVDADGTKIPPKRWKQMYFESKELERGKVETERKFNLYKELGQDKYYELYPEEVPVGWKPNKPTQTDNAEYDQSFEMGEMQVKGGKYNGYTLNEVYQVDPAMATYLQNQHLNSEREKVLSQTQQQENIRKESEREVSEFTDTLVSEFFPGKKVTELTKDEEQKVAETIEKTLKFMSNTRRGGGFLADAYFLMNREQLIKNAKETGGKLALESLTNKSIVPSIDGAGGGSVGNAYENMSAEQLLAKLDKMSDAETVKFYEEAPEAIRKKYPDMPWLNS